MECSLLYIMIVIMSRRGSPNGYPQTISPFFESELFQLDSLEFFINYKSICSYGYLLEAFKQQDR
jgi:hypothetical protein